MKWISVFVLLMGWIALGCSDDKDDNGGLLPPSDPKLEAGLTELLFERGKAAEKLAITSNVKWTATSTVTWCELSKKTGTGNDTIQVAVGDNVSTNRRDGKIILTAGGNLKIEIPVVQLGEEIEILYFVNGQEVNKSVEIDFETAVHQLRIMSNIAVDYRFEKASWFQYQFLGGDTKDWNFQCRSADNEGDSRDALLIMDEIEGGYVDTLVLVQKAYSDFLRFFSDTVYAGSHYSLVQVMGRTTVNWEYEMINQPAWVTNVEKENPFAPQLLGERSSLILDLKTNTDPTPRRCQVKFKYNVGGKSQEKVVNIVQLANNPRSSDSLVLIKLLIDNSEPGVGLQVTNWFDEYPITQWSGPTFEEIDGVKRIVKLELNGACMCYPLTADIGNLSELRELNLGKNFLRGSLPKEIGRLKKLEVLDVNENYESGKDNPTNKLCGISDIPMEIATGCTKLRKLAIALNGFKAIPEAVYAMKNLEHLNIGMNYSLSGVDNEKLKGLTKLKEVDFDRIAYRGPLLDFFYECPLLESLNFNLTHFSGETELSGDFSRLPELRSFMMDSCNLTGSLPVSLSKCEKIEYISLYGNALSGTLPPEYGELDKLYALNLSDNNLTGSIPKEYVTLGNIGLRMESTSHLFLNGNLMSGEIPAEIKALQVWTDQILWVQVPWDPSGRTHFIGNWSPLTFICPQRGPGFTNCDMNTNN